MSLSLTDRIWLGIGASVLIGVPFYNVFIAEDGKTLSEAFDGYLKRWPWLKPVTLTLVRHVVNDLDPRIDPIGLGFAAARAVFRRRGRTVVVVVDD
jgi:hypothetical protein